MARELCKESLFESQAEMMPLTDPTESIQEKKRILGGRKEGAFELENTDSLDS